MIKPTAKLIAATISRCRSAFHGASISHLHISRRPSTVFRRVGAVIVNAIDRVIRGWARTHVRDESRIVMQPSLAHINTAATVMAKGPIAWIRTAIFRGRPNHVLGRQASLTADASRGAVRQIQPRRRFAPDTAATFRQSIYEAWTYDLALRAALTLTQPARMLFARAFADLANDDKSPELTTCQIA